MSDSDSESGVPSRDLRLELRARNNVLWHAIYDRYGSVSELCRQMSAVKLYVSQVEVGRLLNLKRSPWKSTSWGGRKGFCSTCLRLEAFLKIPAEDLFPEHLYTLIGESVRVLEVDSFAALPATVAAQVRTLPAPVEFQPDSYAERKELADLIDKALQALSPRDRGVVSMYYGLGKWSGETHTLVEIGRAIGVTHTRVQQILARGIRRLQHPEHARALEVFVSRHRVLEE